MAQPVKTTIVSVLTFMGEKLATTLREIDMSMFCFQCQEAAKGTGCTVKGVCGKDESTAKLQDLLIYDMKGIAVLAKNLKQALFLERINDPNAPVRFKYPQKILGEKQIETYTTVELAIQEYPNLSNSKLAKKLTYSIDTIKKAKQAIKTGQLEQSRKYHQK